MHYIKIDDFLGVDYEKFKVYMRCNFIEKEVQIATFADYKDACKFAKMKSFELGLPVKDETTEKFMKKIKKKKKKK